MIYTFYSYKGGVGRSHLLANLASYLCYYRKRRVLLIDWDLEAPGLHFYFGKKDKDITTKGLIDLCEHYIQQAENASPENPLTENDLLFPNEDYLTNLVTAKNGGKIDLLPATTYEQGYHNHINAFDWIDFYDNKTGNVYLVWLQEQLRKAKYYDYVFIDSRTGQNDYSGICNVLMPDMNIVVVAPNVQNYEGAIKMTDRILNATYTKENRKDKAFILPILSKVDNFFGERADEWKAKFVDYFAFTIPIFEETLKPFSKEVLDIILSKTILNYNAEFAMGERTYFTEEAPDLKASSYLKNFENIAVEFLEEMHEAGEISINKIVGDKMIPMYLKLIKENMLLDFAYFGLGNAYAGLQNYTEAIKNYQKAIEIKPDKHEAWYNLGIAHYDLKDYAQAILAYQKAIDIKPDYQKAWNNLGNAHSAMQDYAQAIDAFQKAIDIKPDDHEAWYNLGIAHYDLKDYAQAILAYQKAIDIKPDYQKAWNNLGNAHSAMQDYAQAILAYQKAIDIKPDFHEAWNNLGIAHYAMQDYAQAILAYQKAIDIKPDDHQAWCNLGIAHKNMQDYAQAILAYQKAIEIKPDKHEAWYNLGSALDDMQNYAQAILAYQKAIDIKPDLHEAWNNLGIAHKNMQDYAQAILAYQKAIDIKPDYHEAWNNLGIIYSTQKEYNQAKECFERALLIKPDYESAMFNLACLHSLQQNKTQALAYLQQAIAQNTKYKAMSQTDSDFEWLWTDADFQALIQ